MVREGRRWAVMDGDTVTEGRRWAVMEGRKWAVTGGDWR